MNSSTSILLEDLIAMVPSERDRRKKEQLIHSIIGLLDRQQNVSALPDLPGRTAGTDTFDIFARLSADGAKWCDCVAGIRQVLSRMNQMSADSPGDYFVFHRRTHATLFQVRNKPVIVS